MSAPPIVEKNKKWQMELLMERLRNKASQQKSFPELSKSTRMALLEKRYALDAVEKANLQKCLDSMQHCIKVTSKQGLVERLESLTRQLGLKYMEENSSLFISSDMFYLEILLDQGGSVVDVKVHHECKSLQSCSELVECLAKGDFSDFTAQLEGFASIYQLNAEPKIKSKAFMALQALEQDVYNMFQLKNYFPDVISLVMQSPTGLVQKRRGGHSMKLTYFLPPMELLDLQSKAMHVITPEFIHTKGVGLSVTINLEASVAHKLQIQPILNLTDPQNITYEPLTTYNSTMLPASFVLTLNKPMPICQSLIKHLRVTDLPCTTTGDEAQKVLPIMGLISSSASNGTVTNMQKGLLVNLPDQCHCFFMTENRDMVGEVVTSIPFTEPGQVFEIVQLLRQQGVFNTLIGSCVRTNAKAELFDAMTIFEVTALSTQHINVALEHPFDDSMITVEFDLSKVASVQCKIFPTSPANEQLSMKLSRVAQTCMSIPITMRTLIKAFEQANKQQMNRPADNNSGSGFGLAEGGMDAGTSADPGKGAGTSSGSSNGGASLNNNINNGGMGNADPNERKGNVHSGGAGLFDTAYNVFDPGAGPQQSQQGPAQQVITACSTDELDGGMAIKKRRVTGEDFWKSPKRTNNKLSEDSNSLGSDGGNGMESKKSKAGAAEERSEVKKEEESKGETGQDTQLLNGIGTEVGDDRRDKEEEDGDTLMDCQEGDSQRENVKSNAVQDEDDDLGNILNEIKNNKELNDLFNKAAVSEEDVMASRSSASSSASNSNSPVEVKKFNSIEEQLATMGTPYVSITPIPAINSSVLSSSYPVPPPSTTTTTKSTTIHQQEPQKQNQTTTSSTKIASTTGNNNNSSSSSTTTTTVSSTLRMNSSSGSSSTSISSCLGGADAANIKSVLSDMGISTDKRLAIEIIPLSPSVVAAAINPQQHSKSAASVTITAIDVDPGKGSSSNRGIKKSSSSSALGTIAEEQERARIKKRRMEEYSEKIRKSQSSGGGGGSRPGSQSASPKYATSPRPTSIFNNSSSSGGRGSPKQTGSPKGDSRSPYSSSVSPKSGSSSSSSGSGKPSMSTLKSAVSPKGDKTSQKSSSSSSSAIGGQGGSSSGNSNRDRDREREKKMSGSPKIKPSLVKLKAIDLNAGSQDEHSQDGLKGLSGSLFKSGSAGKAKNSLSAVIDKLKSAQGPEGDLILKALEKQSREKVNSSSTSVSSGISSSAMKMEKSVDGQGTTPSSSSYIIKPSSDGMKLTINKTKSRSDGQKSSGSSSLPRSQSSSNLKTSSSSGKKYGSLNSYSSSSSGSKSKLPFQKSSSSGNLSSPSTTPSSSGYKSSSSSTSTKSSSGNAGDSGKSNSEKKQSKTTTTTVSDGLTKATTPQDVLKLLGLPSSNSMDGFMKSLDKKFQIPKLSARSTSTEDYTKRSSSSNSAPTTPTGPPPALSITASDPKLLTDFLTKEVPLKYPFPLNLNANYSSLLNRSNPKTMTGITLDEVTIEKVSVANTNSNSVESSFSSSPSLILERINQLPDGEVMRPPSAPPINQTNASSSSDSATVGGGSVIDLKIKPIRDPSPVGGQSAAMSGSSASGKLTPSFHPPSSPSVSLHIVKSPVPSPMMIAASPHANSPHCSVTDDELMDEALVGISGK